MGLLSSFSYCYKLKFKFFMSAEKIYSHLEPNLNRSGGKRKVRFQEQEPYPPQPRTKKEFDLGTYLQNYDQDIVHQSEEEQLQETLEADLENLQNNIAAYGFPPLGRFFTGKGEDVRQTFASIHAMLKQRAKDLEFRSDVYQKIQKAESDKKMSDLNLERLKERHEAVQQELGGLKQQFKAQESRWKQEKERLTAERDELNKVAVRLQQKESQYMHEMRKKEQIYTKLQDQIRKNAFEKSNVTYQNSIEMTAPLMTNGPQLFHRGSDTEFTNLVTRGYEDLQNKLIAQNTDLRQCLKMLQQQMLDIVAFKREAYQKRYGHEMPEELEQGGLNPLHDARLQQPFHESGEDVIRLYQDNMRRLRQFLNRCGMRERAMELEDGEGSEHTVMGKLQSLMSKKVQKIEQYRALADAQENILFKSIMKQNTVKPPEEISQTNSRFRTITETEQELKNELRIEQYKRFLTDQKMMLQRNQQDLENEKSILSQTAKSLDEEKLKIAHQRQKLKEEKEKLKENIGIMKNQ